MIAACCIHGTSSPAWVRLATAQPQHNTAQHGESVSSPPFISVPRCFVWCLVPCLSDGSGVAEVIAEPRHDVSWVQAEGRWHTDLASPRALAVAGQHACPADDGCARSRLLGSQPARLLRTGTTRRELAYTASGEGGKASTDNRPIAMSCSHHLSRCQCSS
jgi:hypothetical protein